MYTVTNIIEVTVRFVVANGDLYIVTHIVDHLNKQTITIAEQF